MSHNPYSFKLKEMEAEGGLKIALDQQFGDFWPFFKASRCRAASRRSASSSGLNTLGRFSGKLFFGTGII